MDHTAKRKLLRHVPYGIYIVGVGRGPTADAFTGSWLTQASMKPPCVALGLRHESRALELVRSERVFVINFMPRGDLAPLKQCVRSDPGGAGRLTDLPYQAGHTGAPILDAAIGYLECEVRHLADDFGDHALAVGEIVGAGLRSDDAPLVMADTGWTYGG